jgi:LmbE family N-acetylglucosaminyl deacetylase
MMFSGKMTRLLDESTFIGRRMIRVAATLLAAAAILPAGGLKAQVAVAEKEYTGDDRIEKWKDKTVLVVTPHPDDDTFNAGGLMTKLASNGNNVQVLIYTSDNAGSNDPTMTKERLATIRKREEEEACAILGVPKDHITWLGHDDGMLEYVDRRDLTKQVAREIRRHKPDAVLSIDPGAPHEQWHKSDHRSGAVITADAMRAAAWRLYFPELEREGFKQHKTPVVFFFYSAQPNYTVDITDVAEKKSRAAAAHTSQFGAMVTSYDENKLEERREGLAKMLQASPLVKRKDGKIVEEFRRSVAYGE